MKGKARHILQRILSTLVACGAFLYSYIYFDYSLFFSIIIAAAFFVATWVVLPRPGSSNRMALSRTPGPSEKVITEGRAKVRSIRKIVQRIRKREVRERVERIVQLALQIFDDLERDPKGITLARQFHSYYLDASATIIHRYVELIERPQSGEIEAAVLRAESSLETIEEAFERQLKRMLEDDMLNLDTEIELLEKTLALNGHIKKKGNSSP